MKRLVLVLMAFAIRIGAQSDCGNCWVVGGPQCDPLAICDAQGLCQVCMEFVDCDDHSCAYRSPWYCLCPWGPAIADKQPCLGIPREKGIVAKQKEKNAAQVKKVAWYRWSPIWNNAKH